MMRKYFLNTVLSAFCVFLAASASAQSIECEQVPDCTLLGYEASVNCENEATIACPFDTSYKRCVNVSCSDLGYTKSGKEKWCKNILKCPTNETYTLCADGCGTYCPEGSSWNPVCQYGRTLVGTDGCSNNCYSCKSCPLDEQRGWDSAVSSCTSSQYVISVLKSLCGLDETRYICGQCPEHTVAAGTNAHNCVCDEANGWYAYCPDHMICEGVSTLFGSCQRVIGPEEAYDPDGNPTPCEAPSSTTSSKTNYTCSPTGKWYGEEPCYACHCEADQL